MASKDPVKIIEGEVSVVKEQAQELAALQTALLDNPQFARFMELSKTIDAAKKEVRERVAAVVIPAYERGEVDKTIKGELFSITVIESDEFTADVKELPKDLKTVVPKMDKIRDHFHLHGKVPKGATYKGKKYGIRLSIIGVE